MTKRFYRAEDEGKHGYMRGEWLEVGMDADTGEDGGRRVCRVYDTLEDMKKDKAVYKAVRSAIQTAHMEDGASMADITKETDEQ